MAVWAHTLHLVDVWSQANDDIITHRELANVIKSRLGMLPNVDENYINNMRDELIDEFEAISEDDESDIDDFNYVMEKLYDWGDLQVGGEGFFDAVKNCWIKTVF